MSLRILAGLDLGTHPVHFGIMLQACASKNYREMIARYPCMEMDYCGVIQGKCPYNGEISQCHQGLQLKKFTTTISDSGVFTKNGTSFDYYELFNRYQMMGVERGIILDVLRDYKKTILSAKKGYEVYSQHDFSFKLIGVAQGKNTTEYLQCYEKLLKIGYKEIAIGGLLTKKMNTARYAHSNKAEIAAVVNKIQTEYPDDRCFVLGVYNPKRHEFLEALGVNGADYKGWIFQYTRHFNDPHWHHVDRVMQTQYFIEKNILSRMSNKTAKEKSVRFIHDKIKSNICLNGSRVFIKNNTSPSIANQENQTIIISCGKKKNHVRECYSKDAYIGNSFRLKRKYAELKENPWFILSAKYGLLRPETKINPNYNQTITRKKDVGKLAKLVQSQIPSFPELSRSEKLIFLGPSAYAKALKLMIMNYPRIKFIHLTEGLNQGKSLQKIKDLIKGHSL